MKFPKPIRTLYLALNLCVILLEILWVVTAFPKKWGEFEENKKRSNELSEEIRELESQEKAFRWNRDRFEADKYFVQKLAHEIGYAHEEEVIFQFSDAVKTNNDRRRQ